MTRLIIFISIITFANISIAQQYFQQEVNYKISVKLDDVNHKIYCSEQIEYINNSPDTLHFIYFHLWPNAYKNTNTAFAKQQLENGSTDFYFSNESQKGYISNLDFEVNGKKIKWEFDPKNIDIAKLVLNTPLTPNARIIITTPFNVKFPGTFSRLGHYKQSYQVTQWYPKPAVYDNNGWHAMPYLNQGEFYSEFGAFEVSITLPRNYVVGATGNLQTDSELNFLDSIANVTEKIDSFDSNDISFPKSDKEFKTITYKESNIHDFAWFADKRFHVKKGSVKLPNSDKEVTTWVMFTNYEAKLWKDALEYVNNGVYYYSKWLGNYPYDNCTAIEASLGAGGGMEYPTITNIGHSGNKASLETVIVHEVGHNWLYGIIANDERCYPWMDESINTFYHTRYSRIKYPNQPLVGEIPNNVLDFFDLEFNHFSTLNLGYLYLARLNKDQELNTHSEKFNMINYGFIAYFKGAVGFNLLINYLGEEKFDSLMQAYYQEWKFKHPQPNDFKEGFKLKDDNLNWFFNGFLSTTKKIDYKVQNLKNMDSHYILRVKNKGGINAPFSVNLYKNDSLISSFWEKGFTGKTDINLNSNFDKVVLNSKSSYGEFNIKNNIIFNRKIAKKLKPISLRFIGSLENKEKTQLYYLPIIGYNKYNKFMIGTAFYNTIFPANNLEFQLLPMYSFGSNNIAGLGSLSYFIHPDKLFREISISISTKQFAYNEQTNFNSNKLNTEFVFSKKNKRSKITNTVNLSTTMATDITTILLNDVQTKQNYFHKLEYKLSNRNKLKPYTINLSLEGKNTFLKTTFYGKYRIKYKKKHKEFNISLFASKFVYNNSNNGIYNLNLSGNMGYQDYTYNEIYFARFDGYYPANLFNRQFSKTEGSFNIYTPIQSNNWLVTTEISSTIPIKFPIKPYLNLGLMENYNISSSQKIILLYELGIELYIIKDIFSIYFPVNVSKEIKETNELYTDNYFEKIRFVLNLNKVNPFKLIKNIEL